MHTNGFGFATTGVRCRTSRNLPQVRHCFCVLLLFVCCLFLFYCFLVFFFSFLLLFWLFFVSFLLLFSSSLFVITGICCYCTLVCCAADLPEDFPVELVGQSALMPWDESDSGGFCQYLFCSISYFWILWVSSKIFPCPLFLFVLDQFYSAGVLLLGWCLFSSLLSLCSSPWAPCKVIIVSS